MASGRVVRAAAVGQVVKSNHPDFRVGQFVQGGFGWQDYAVTNEARLLREGYAAEDVQHGFENIPATLNRLVTANYARALFADDAFFMS